MTNLAYQHYKREGSADVPKTAALKPFNEWRKRFVRMTPGCTLFTTTLSTPSPCNRTSGRSRVKGTKKNVGGRSYKANIISFCHHHDPYCAITHHLRLSLSKLP